MRYTVINGERHKVSREWLEASDIEVGQVLVEREGRRVYRVVAIDGRDAIMRNVRRPDLVVAESLLSVAEEYCAVIPR